jgi:hypothetical protein
MGKVSVLSILRNRITSLYDADQEHDDRDHKKDVDEAAEDVESEVPEKPQNDKNRCYGGKHGNVDRLSNKRTPGHKYWPVIS